MSILYFILSVFLVISSSFCELGKGRGASRTKESKKKLKFGKTKTETDTTCDSSKPNVCCSVSDGDWESPQTWSCKRIPNEKDSAHILHNISFTKWSGKTIKLKNLILHRSSKLNASKSDDATDTTNIEVQQMALKPLAEFEAADGVSLKVDDLTHDGAKFKMGKGKPGQVVFTSKRDLMCNRRSKIDTFSAKLENGKRNKFGCTLYYDQRAEDSDESFIVMAQDLSVEEEFKSTVLAFSTAVTGVDEEFILSTSNAVEEFKNLIMYFQELRGADGSAKLSYPGGGMVVGGGSEKAQSLVNVMLEVHATLVQWLSGGVQDGTPQIQVPVPDAGPSDNQSLVGLLDLIADILVTFGGVSYPSSEVTASSLSSFDPISASKKVSVTISQEGQTDSLGNDQKNPSGGSGTQCGLRKANSKGCW